MDYSVIQVHSRPSYFLGRNADPLYLGSWHQLFQPMSTRLLIIWCVITVVVTVLDYLVPSYLTKKSGGSVYASRGALAGLLIGLLFFGPLGIVLGPMLGAFLCEIIFGKKTAGQSIVPALGAFAGFLCGTGLKLIASGMMMYYIFVYIR